MLLTKRSLTTLSGALFLGACATTPMGPTVQVMPGANKPFQVFASEQASCKDYAVSQVKEQADSANQQAIGTALISTALGAGLGAAVGGGQGAGIGAAGGSVLGAGIGADRSNNAQLSIQQQYDNAYMQCMYAKGNQVPGMAAAVAPPPPPVPVAVPAPVSTPKKTNAVPPPPPSDAPPPPPQ